MEEKSINFEKIIKTVDLFIGHGVNEDKEALVEAMVEKLNGLEDYASRLEDKLKEIKHLKSAIVKMQKELEEVNKLLKKGKNEKK